MIEVNQTQIIHEQNGWQGPDKWTKMHNTETDTLRSVLKQLHYLGVVMKLIRLNLIPALCPE